MPFPMINPTPAFYENGAPLSGGTIEFRDPGTDLLKDTYPTPADASNQTNANPNPITLNQRGESPTGIFFRDAEIYKVTLFNASSTQIWQRDRVESPLSGLGTNGAASIGIQDSGGNYNATNVENALAELASNASGEGASVIGIEDSASNFTATDVEGALAEIFTDFASTSANLGASLVGVQDLSGRFTGTDVEAVLDEIGERIQTKFKSGNQASSTTTLGNDNHLTFAGLEADRYYRFRLYLHGVQNGGNMDFTFNFTNAPQAGNVTWQGVDTGGTAVNNHGTGILTNEFLVSGFTSGLNFGLNITGWFASNATTGGNLTFQFAKNTSSGGDTQLNEGSWMELSFDDVNVV